MLGDWVLDYSWKAGPNRWGRPEFNASFSSANPVAILVYQTILNILCILSYYYALLHFYYFDYFIDNFITIISYYTCLTKDFYTHDSICIIRINFFQIMISIVWIIWLLYQLFQNTIMSIILIDVLLI